MAMHEESSKIPTWKELGNELRKNKIISYIAIILAVIAIILILLSFFQL